MASSSPPQSPPAPEGPCRKVFVPVDGSPDSERAFMWYINNMKRPTDVVKVFHVPEPVSLPLVTLKEGQSTETITLHTSQLSEREVAGSNPAGAIMLLTVKS